MKTHSKITVRDNNNTQGEVTKTENSHLHHPLDPSRPARMTKKQQPSFNGRIRLLFPAILSSFLIFGTARIVLENMKKNQRQANKVKLTRPINISEAESIVEECNVFEGKWVWDNVSYPLYKEDSCPYLVKQVTCLRNGRPDSLYQNWRWQPHGCTLPRFDSLKLLEILRDKTLMFVGDSIQRGQFESMICLLQSVIPEGKKFLQRTPPMKIFKAQEFNATIVYYWAPFIVESISDHMTNHTVLKRLVNLDAISRHGKQWEGVNVLVFESYVWWMYNPRINATYGSRYNVREYNVTTAYRLALQTWANWMETKINSHKQKVYFMSMSPTHLWSWEWRPGSDENCFNEPYPIQGPYWGTGSNLEIMEIVRDVLRGLKVDVTLLNITQLSEFRRDAHTTVFTERKGKLLTKEQKSNPKMYADCIHWCLPGVPDAWNEILYAHLLRDYKKSWSLEEQQKV